MKQTEPKPLTVNGREAARLLGLSVRAINAMRIRGQLKAVPLNPKAKSSIWLYLYESIEKFAKGVSDDSDNRTEG